MRIAVVGAGGQGTFLAGLLTLAGEDVTLIVRAGRAAELNASGVAIVRESGERRVARVRVVDGAIAAGDVADVIVLAVKMYDLVEAARSAAPLVGPLTHMMTIQNGIAAPGLVAGLYSQNRVLACVSYTRTLLRSPGVVVSGGVAGGLELGGLAAVDVDAVDRVADTLSRAGLDACRRDDIETALWEKLLIVCVTGGVMARARSPLGPVLAVEEGREFTMSVIREAAAVAAASGVPLTGDAAARALEFVMTRVGPNATSSMLEDVLAGRKLELEWINGEIVRRGREFGISTPANLAITTALEPYAGGSGG